MVSPAYVETRQARVSTVNVILVTIRRDARPVPTSIIRH